MNNYSLQLEIEVVKEAHVLLNLKSKNSNTMTKQKKETKKQEVF
jgi:hypothetical protein